MSASYDQTVRLWDSKTGQELKRIHVPTNLEAVVFTPDGRHCLAGGADGIIRRFDLTIGKQVQEFTGHAKTITSLAFSPDGKQFLSGSVDKTVRLWSLDNKTPSREFTGHKYLVTGVAFLSDGQKTPYALSASYDLSGNLCVWDVDSGREAATLSGHKRSIRCLAVSPDGRRAATGGLDGSIFVWDVKTKKSQRTLAGHKHEVWAVAFSRDGRYLGSAGGAVYLKALEPDNVVRVWDVETGKELQQFPGHSGCVRTVAFSLDGRSVYSAGDDRVIRVWPLPQKDSGEKGGPK